jgi:hypothetical protein
VPLNSLGKVEDQYLPTYMTSPMYVRGFWDLRTNTPYLSPTNSSSKGDFYFVAREGYKYLSGGAASWEYGDSLLFDGSLWQKIRLYKPVEYAVHSMGGRAYSLGSTTPGTTSNNTTTNSTDVSLNTPVNMSVPSYLFTDGLLLRSYGDVPRTIDSRPRRVVLPSAREIVFANPYIQPDAFIVLNMHVYSYIYDLGIQVGNSTIFENIAFPPFKEETDGSISIATGYWDIQFNMIVTNVTNGFESAVMQLDHAFIAHNGVYDGGWSWTDAMSNVTA